MKLFENVVDMVMLRNSRTLKYKQKNQDRELLQVQFLFGFSSLQNLFYFSAKTVPVLF